MPGQQQRECSTDAPPAIPFRESAEQRRLGRHHNDQSHQDLDGNRRITIFERGTARLVAHEIDHLNGIVYTDRLAGEYRPGGQN